MQVPTHVWEPCGKRTRPRVLCALAVVVLIAGLCAPSLLLQRSLAQIVLLGQSFRTSCFFSCHQGRPDKRNSAGEAGLVVMPAPPSQKKKIAGLRFGRISTKPANEQLLSVTRQQPSADHRLASIEGQLPSVTQCLPPVTYIHSRSRQLSSTSSSTPLCPGYTHVQATLGGGSVTFRTVDFGGAIFQFLLWRAMCAV